jgi:predicted RNA-binding protein with PUA-like domain
MSVWIFQAVPKEYDLKKELRERRDDWWRVTRLWKEMRKGDGVIFWQAGKESGIYGVGELTSNLYPAEPKFRVKVKYTSKFSPPIFKNKLLKHPVLKGLSILQQPYQGTNFRATVEQWNALGLIGPSDMVAV